jgi:ABC-2 type transport system ATP-binding protein
MVSNQASLASSLLHSADDRRLEEPSAAPLSCAPSPDSCALSLDQIGHTYRGGNVALKNISLQIAQGEIVGLLGPNGAGKSSLIKIMCGLMRPTTGTVTIRGRDLFAGGKGVRSEISGLLQNSPVESNMRVREVLALFSSFYTHPCNAKELLAYVGLEDKANARIDSLSGGQRQRVAFARAMIGNPNVLVLDEPTTGLDVAIRREIMALILSLKEKGHSIILSTHLVDEAEQHCDKVAIIHRGQLFGYDTPSRLIKEFGTEDRLEAVFSGPLDENAFVSLLPHMTSRQAGTSEFPFTYLLAGASAETMLLLLAEIAPTCNVPLVSVRILRGGLEGAYLNLTGERIAT